MDRLKKVKGWVFDLDGTLVDSKLDFEKLRSLLGIVDGSPILEYVQALDCLRERERLMRIVDDYEWQSHLHSELIEGADIFVGALKSAGLPLAILTRNSDRTAHSTLERFCFADFNPIISRDHHLPPKPDPQSLLHICKLWNLGPHEIVYVGDFDFDMVAAKNAGCLGLFYNPRRRSVPPEASLSFHSFKEVLEVLFHD